VAVSDPTMSVPTPTGVLQGVAAFNWDGAAWQPAGRAGPSVATPTGNLQGVAAFTGGPSWAPTGRAGPGVATPTGVLDGVAVYTWSGSQWTPPGGTEMVPTPTGGLRGVAAFDWDGTAWQPTAQARSSVPTPYGVLDGVARFGWTGTAWAAVGAPSLSLDFMAPGALDPRITFTRASTATYTDASGTIQTAAVNAPRWDYDPATHALRGLLIEEARTNAVFPSKNWNNIPLTTTQDGWIPNVGASPSGANDAMALVPCVTSGVHQFFVTAALAVSTTYTYSVYVRPMGLPYLYMELSNSGFDPNSQAAIFDLVAGTVVGTNPVLANVATIQRCANGWFRCSVRATTNAGGGTYVMNMRPTYTNGGFTFAGNGVDAVWVYGNQIEVGSFPTSYIPTTSAAVTRTQDNCAISAANMVPWFASPGGTWFAEYVSLLVSPTNNRIIGVGSGGAAQTPLFIASPASFLGQYDGAAPLLTANASVPGSVMKGASSYTASTGKTCLNGGVVASGAMGAGYAALGAWGIFIFCDPQGLTSGHIRRVQYWPRVLSNAEMQGITT
jgi:hypothetical protein